MKRNVIKFLLVLVIALFGVQSVSAQEITTTPYEDQCLWLDGETAKRMADVYKEYATPEEQFVFGLMLAKYLESVMQANNGVELYVAYEHFLGNFLGMSLLVDPGTAYEYQLQLIAKWYFAEKQKLQKYRTAVDDERDRERKSE